MILISHRGNLEGKCGFENQPERIDYVLFLGFKVEIDLWVKSNEMFLGHDNPEFKIDLNWLFQRGENIWIHCKNLMAVELLNSLEVKHKLNYFFHDTDFCTLTSKGYIWVYPGKQPVKNSIAVMPEIHNDDISDCLGICSDYILNYDNKSFKK
ncbi:hypothetical protein OAU12_03415 [Flavobacteriaceae bacterium]|nr:hypothetical protein [Flavobacteriaceae bacterium]